MSQLTDNLSAIAAIKSDIAAAIESKGVSMSGVSFGSYADKIGEISGGGGLTQKDVTEKNFEWTVINNSASYVGSYIFYLNSFIQRVSLSGCGLIQLNAFGQCSNLSEISLPKCSYIGDYAFIRCSRLAYVDLPECKSATQQVFSDCTAISYVSMPKCSLLDYYAFQNCKSLVDVYLPECLRIRPYVFSNCSSLENIYIPKVTTIDNNAFQSCYKLSEVSLPECWSLGQNVFYNCSSLSQLTLCTDTYKFCNWNNFLYGTPLTSGVGSIYVAIENYDRYITATGWSSLSARIVGVGDPGDPMLSYSDGLVYGRTETLYYSFWSDLGVSSNTITAVSLPDCSMLMDYYGTNPGATLAGLSNLRTVYIGELSSTVRYYFQNCNNLEYVYLPKCKYISEYTFYSCSRSLRVVSIPACEYLGRGAISWASLVSKIELPACSYIGNNAFYSCLNLEEILLGYSGVCKLEDTAAFMNTPKKSAIYVPESLVDAYKADSMWSWYSSMIFPILPDLIYRDGLVYGWATSLDSGYLNTLDITASDVTGLSLSRLVSVASSTFMNHYNLTDISIPNVGEYPDDTFNGCSALSEVTIGVSALGNRVFANCAGLERVVVDYNGVIDAGSDLFLNCPNLSQIELPLGYDSAYYTAPGWSEYSSLFYVYTPELAFSNGVLFGSISSIGSDYRTILGSNISSNAVLEINLPYCQYVGSSTFYYHQSLVSVNLPVCSYIGRDAFREDNQMAYISIPQCEYIGEYVFQGAFQLNSTGSQMSLSLDVCSYISTSAFYWTQRSWTFTLGSDSVVTLQNGSNVFQATQIDSIYVPASLVESYKTAYGWSYWSNRIYPIQ